MKICFFITDLADGGAQKQCIYLANEIKNRDDVELHFVYMHSGVNDYLLNRDGLKLTRLPVLSNYDPRNIQRLRRLLLDVRPDLLMTWLHAADTYAFFAKRCIPGLRWIMAERNSHYPADPRFWLRKCLGRYADAIIANSVQGAAYWSDARPSCPIFVIPNIVHRIPHIQRESRGKSVLYVGRLEPAKNVATVVRAFCVLAARNPGMAFKIVGDGSLRRELEAIVQDAGLSNQVVFLGYLRSVSDLIAQAGVLVSLSHHEGLPNVLLESVAAKTTIVASDITSHRELLGPMYPYYVSDRNDPIACANTIEDALGSNDSTLFTFVDRRISEMAPDIISSKYIDVFYRLRQQK
jgi:glycosyltransferase involved in cell wall biosynthesis